MAFYITKRKLTRAIRVAIEDGKIPDSPYEYYSIGVGKAYPEYGLHWPERNLTIEIHRREDNTIYLGCPREYETGSPYDGWINESIWEGPSK